MSLVANARMYAINAQLRTAWQSLFAWVAQTSGVPLIYLDYEAPAPLEALWARSDLGAVFMCGLPFSSASHRPRLVAAPIFARPRYGDLPCYCTDLIVRADTSFTCLSDTFGGRIGWTVEHSQSGYAAVRQHLLHYAPDRPESLFSRWVGPLLTPRRVVEAVLEGTIDVGPLDSHVLDLLRRHEPETARLLRVVESTAMTPNPPLVASPQIADNTVEELRGALQSCVAEPTMATMLDTLQIRRFAPIDATIYDVLRQRAQAMDARWA
jgi:ABC-type phosphate/phosphonate transport system substrate-binding protein